MGRLGNCSQCIKGSTQNEMQTDFTLVEKRDEEGWWVVKVELEMKKIILDGTFRNSNENLLQKVVLKFRERECLEERHSLNEKRVNNWKEKRMYGQFIRDTSLAQTKKTPGPGWKNLIWRYQLKHWYVLYKNKQ